MDTSRLPGLDFRPIHPDPVDNSKQRLRRPGVYRGVGVGPLPERRSTISAVSHPAATHLPHNTRVRNLSGGSAGSAASSASSVASSSMGSVHDHHVNHHFCHEHVTPHLHGYDVTAAQQHLGTNNSGAMSQQSKIGINSNNNGAVSQHQQHRKLDRSLSDASSDSDRMSNNGGVGGNNRSGNGSRYKTELCRPFEENGSCKYGDKCQFAHGYHELRNLSRHPKYKTELCRTFHTVGFCPYGPRCHFIHEDDGKVEPAPPKTGNARQPSRAASNYTPTSSSGSCSPSLSPAGSDTDYSAFTYHQEHNTDMLSLESSFSSLNFSPNDPHQFGGNFSSGSSSSNNNQQFDIFSQVTMFDSQAVEKISKPSYPAAVSAAPKVDNFPFLNTSGLWKNDNGFQMCPPPQHHSPTGSTGSDGGVSDCSSSMESLASSGCRDHPTAGFTFPPFAAQHWIS